MVTQTNRFKAAVDEAGPGDLFTFYGEMDPEGGAFGIGVIEDSQGDMRGTPWEKRDKYIENSPYSYLDRIRTPLVIEQGTADEGMRDYNAD